jgi:aminoglycoside phosphotransferase (APT) family kinase protein
MTDPQTLQRQLTRYYQTQQPAIKNPTITALTHISDGWENEVYAFGVEHDGGRDERILRIYPGDNAVEKSAREFNGMRQLFVQGYPVPEVFIHEGDPAWFGKPFVIMQKIDGQQMGSERNAAPNRRQALLTQFCQLFVDLHRLDISAFLPPQAPTLRDDPFWFIRQTLQEWQAILVAVGHNEFEPVMTWIEDRMPNLPCQQYSVLHGDFHDLNILINPAGEPFVIDWTNIGVGDFRFDLAWTLLLHGLYGGDEDRELILTEYQRIAGAEVQGLEFFEVMALTKRLASVTISIADGAEKLGMRPEAAAIMKQEKEKLAVMVTRLKGYTGIALPDVEQLIETLN